MDLEYYQEQATSTQLARTIREFWKKQGYKIDVKVIMAPGNIFNIVSNIGPNGYPPRV